MLDHDPRVARHPPRKVFVQCNAYAVVRPIQGLRHTVLVHFFTNPAFLAHRPVRIQVVGHGQAGQFSNTKLGVVQCRQQRLVALWHAAVCCGGFQHVLKVSVAHDLRFSHLAIHLSCEFQ